MSLRTLIKKALGEPSGETYSETNETEKKIPEEKNSPMAKLIKNALGPSTSETREQDESKALKRPYEKGTGETKEG